MGGTYSTHWGNEKYLSDYRKERGLLGGSVFGRRIIHIRMVLK
jgi:hypothetical protein